MASAVANAQVAGLTRVMVRGDAVAFELRNGQELVLPPGLGMLHDPSGTVFPPCEFPICAFDGNDKTDIAMTPEMQKIVVQHFGDGAKWKGGDARIPQGPWTALPDAKRIYYVRKGHKAGRYHHDFAEPMPIFINSTGTAAKLVLPAGCIVNERGIVWP